MSEQHLLDFILRKLDSEPNEVVLVRDGREQTLSEVFTGLGLDTKRLSVHALETSARSDAHSRFRSSHGTRSSTHLCSELQAIFLSTDNATHGRYFAELAKEVFGTLDGTTPIPATT